MKKIRRKQVRNWSLLAAAVALSAWLFISIKSLPSLADLFTAKPIAIQNTPVVVKQIQALAQLVTVSMYEEIVVDSNVNNSKSIDVPLLPSITFYNDENTLVMIGKVTAQVGIDMQAMSNSDISGTTDSIHILLPPAQVLDAIINPSDVNIFIEKGVWDNAAIVALKNKIKTLAVADAQSRGLLPQSENKALQILTDFFTAAGYKKVIIQFRQNTLPQS